MAMIYALKNKVTGKAYIGYTGKLSKRFREHRCLLRNGKHSEWKLQDDWFIYGEENFTMDEVQKVPDDAGLEEKRSAELYWIDRMTSQGLCYNRNRVSFAVTEETWRKGQPIATRTEGRKRSPEANLKRRLAQLGIPKGHGAKISATKQSRKLMR
jgi:group I intron endonuclease